jgi:hypothetical protein
MTQGPMQFGTTNDAGDSPTKLTSTTNLQTLLVVNTRDFPLSADALVGVGNITGVRGSGKLFGVNGRGFPPSGFEGPGGVGVIGTGRDTGVQGRGNKFGVVGLSSGSPPGLAGFFRGDVSVTGNLVKGGGGFKVDHPLDPANKYLSHSFVEAPEPLNVYSGTVSTDADGTATVTLPGYFDALNTDLRYQLTVIGQFAQAIVADEVSGNQFTIRTDQPNVIVSWQVSGVRKDRFAATYPIVVEEEKPPEERGSYLHPETYGRPESEGVHYERVQKLQESVAEE